MTRHARPGRAALFAAVLGLSTGMAQALTLLAADTGTVTSSAALGTSRLRHDASIASVFVNRNFFGSTSSDSRGYALFDVDGSLPEALTLQLRFTVIATGSAQLSLFDITTPGTSFQVSFDSQPGPLPAFANALFADLAGGIPYGTLSGIGLVSMEMVMPLDSAAVGDFNAARGGIFGIAVSAVGSQTPQITASQFSLEVTTVPESSSGTLLLLGLAGLALRGRVQAGKALLTPITAAETP